MIKLVLLRHGETLWDKEGKLAGWMDVDLSPEGVKQARQAAQRLKKEGYTFDVAFTSVLKRAIRTLWVVQSEMELMWVPTHKSWRLNEQHYGALQGLSEAEIIEKFGEQQVAVWQQTFDVPTPPLTRDDFRFAGNDPRYQDLTDLTVPMSECLKDTVARVLPYWHDTMAMPVRNGKHVLVVAHANSLRALMKELDRMTDGAAAELDIPPAVPIVYELAESLRPFKHYSLAG